MGKRIYIRKDKKEEPEVVEKKYIIVAKMSPNGVMHTHYKKKREKREGFGYIYKMNGYIGQTIRHPACREYEHKKNGRKGKVKVICKVGADHLDRLESYFIGFYNTYINGTNKNRGKVKSMYNKGLRDMKKENANNRKAKVTGDYKAIKDIDISERYLFD